MATIEQKLSSNSLEILRRMASSKDARLKKNITNLRHNRIYRIIFNQYQENHDELVDILYSYGVISQEETSQ